MNIVDAIAPIIENWDIEAFDDEARRINPATGEENQYFNIGIFYQLGSMVDQAAYNLASAKERWDKADAAAADELERNGRDSSQWVILSARAAQQEAHHANARALFDVQVALFNSVSGWTWASGKQLKSDPYGRKWYADEKDRRQARRVNQPEAPTKDDIKARKAEMLARLAG